MLFDLFTSLYFVLLSPIPELFIVFRQIISLIAYSYLMLKACRR